jgi:hypothetical protein
MQGRWPLRRCLRSVFTRWPELDGTDWIRVDDGLSACLHAGSPTATADRIPYASPTTRESDRGTSWGFMRPVSRVE